MVTTTKEILLMTSDRDRVKWHGPTAVTTKEIGKKVFPMD
jgi:hypothetical protein